MTAMINHAPEVVPFLRQRGGPITLASDTTDRTASVRVTSTPAALTIHTTNHSSVDAVRTRQATGSGLVLVGMAERVSVFPGRLDQWP